MKDLDLGGVQMGVQRDTSLGMQWNAGLAQEVTLPKDQTEAEALLAEKDAAVEAALEDAAQATEDAKDLWKALQDTIAWVRSTGWEEPLADEVNAAAQALVRLRQYAPEEEQ